MLWSGWPREASQWVKEDDISSVLTRCSLYTYMHACLHYVSIDIYLVLPCIYCFSSNFDHPQPQEHLIREAVGQFTHSLHRSLRKKCTQNTTIIIPFRHDIASYIVI